MMTATQTFEFEHKDGPYMDFCFYPDGYGDSDRKERVTFCTDTCRWMAVVTHIDVDGDEYYENSNDGPTIEDALAWVRNDRRLAPRGKCVGLSDAEREYVDTVLESDAIPQSNYPTPSRDALIEKAIALQNEIVFHAPDPFEKKHQVCELIAKSRRERDQNTAALGGA